MGKLAAYLGGALMVFPIRHNRKFLNPKEEQELFSYIFAGILFEKGIRSDALTASKLGTIRATVLAGFEMATIHLPRNDRSPEQEGVLDVHLRNGTHIAVTPTQGRAFYLMFVSNFFSAYVYVEVSLEKSGYTLDNVLNVPDKWLEKLPPAGQDEKRRVLKIPDLGQRAMLIESRMHSGYVLELPHISNRDVSDNHSDPFKRHLKQKPLQDYLEQRLRLGIAP